MPGNKVMHSVTWYVVMGYWSGGYQYVSLRVEGAVLGAFSCPQVRAWSVRAVSWSCNAAMTQAGDM
jgi:hypothetical protein